MRLPTGHERAPSDRTPRWVRTARLAAFALICVPLVLAAVTGLGAWIYAYFVLHPGCSGERASLEAAGYPAEAVEFASRRGPTLRGWYTPGSSHKDIAVIVAHGHGSNTSGALPDAAVLANAGYSTLIFEHRSCADPRLEASTGPHEAYDVLGAVDYLRGRGDVAHIGAMGFSASGTAVLLAAAREPAIEAVVPMGGYASLAEDALDDPAAQLFAERVFRRALLWSLTAQIGENTIAGSPLNAIGDIAPRPVLLIYGEHEAEAGRWLYEAAGEPRDLWIVPGAGHGGYELAAPDEYPTHLVSFFDAAFGVERPTR